MADSLLWAFLKTLRGEVQVRYLWTFARTRRLWTEKMRRMNRIRFVVDL